MVTLSLTNKQYAEVKAVASLLPMRHRSSFLENVAQQLEAEPNDAAVTAAIAIALKQGATNVS